MLDWSLPASDPGTSITAATVNFDGDNSVDGGTFQKSVDLDCGVPLYGPNGVTDPNGQPAYGYVDQGYSASSGTDSSLPATQSFNFAGPTNCVNNLSLQMYVGVPGAYSGGSAFVTLNWVVLYLGPGPSVSELFGPGNPAEPHVVRSCGGDPVDCATGNLYETQSDLTSKYHGLNLGITRTYNSEGAAGNGLGHFGYGWTSILDDHLTIDTWSGLATVRQADGSQIPFTVNGGTYTPPGPWAEATLVKRSDGTYLYTLPDRSSIVFASNGTFQSESDRDGNSITATYNAGGQLSQLTDGAGRSLIMQYNADGTVASVTDPDGHTVNYTYAGGNLTGVKEADGGGWAFGYDGSHHLTSLTDPNGNTTTTNYDSSNRVASQTDGLNRTTTWAYGQAPDLANETVITRPGGDVIDEQFSGNQPVAITRGQGSAVATTSSYTYTNGLPTQFTNGDGKSWHYTYDTAGNVLTGTDPLGNKTTWTYDASHDMTSVATPLGHTTTFAYDTAGDLASVTRTITETKTTQKTSYAYDSAGDLTSLTDPRGYQWTYAYDAAGDCTGVTTPLGEKTTWSYDNDGFLQTAVSARGNATGATPTQFTTTFKTDAYGRPTAITDPLGGTTYYSYDGLGNLTAETDSNGHKTIYAYNKDNQLTTVTRPDGTQLGTTYDADGQISSQVNGAGNTTVYVEDAAGRISSVTDPLGRTTNYGYDGADNLTSITDPHGRTITRTYNAANQLTGVSYSDGITPSVSYGYNADGLRTSMTDGSGTTTNTYDSLDRLASETNGAAQKISDAYDVANDLISLTYPNGKIVKRTYDKDGRLATSVDWNNNTTTFGYDPDSDLLTTTFPSTSGEVDTNSYDSADRLNGVTMKRSSTVLASLNYTRDSEGQLQAEASAGLPGTSQSYGYSPLEQLAGLNGANYSYNAADDPTALSGGEGFSYDGADQVSKATYGGLTSNFGYDSLGGRTQGTVPDVASFAYNYDQAERLTSVAVSAASPVLAGGDAFSLGVASDGNVYAWGANTYGQLGNGTTTTAKTPVQVTGLANVASIAAGADHAIALNRDGTVTTWGENNDGQLGNATTTNAATPSAIGLSGVTAVASAPGAYHSLALKNGSVWAWGLNASGQLGNGTTTNSSAPTQVSNLTTASAIAAGANHSLAVQSDGSAWSWGANSCGQLGNGTTTGSLVPVQVTSLTGVRAVAGGTCHSLALKTDGTVWAWGSNTYGQLGNNSSTSSSIPVQVTGLSGVIAIAAGANHSLALESNGSVWAWGENNYGQLGNNSTTNEKVPVKVSGPAGLVGIGAGGYHSLFVTSSGAPFDGGENNLSQLGNNSTSTSKIPVAVSNLAGIQALASAQYSYNGDGLRATSSTAGVTQNYAWDQSGPLPQLLTDGSTNFIYGPGGLPIEQISSSGTILYLHHDQLGSTRLLTTSAGAVAASYAYAPFGSLTGQTGASDTPLRWAGQYQDAATGLYYLRARYEDPQTGQFITRDPAIAATREAYVYTDDNPTTETDPSGLWLGFGWLPSPGDVINFVGNHIGQFAEGVAGAACLSGILTPEGCLASSLLGLGISQTQNALSSCPSVGASLLDTLGAVPGLQTAGAEALGLLSEGVGQTAMNVLSGTVGGGAILGTTPIVDSGSGCGCG